MILTQVPNSISYDFLLDPIYPTPPLGQDMTQGQFLSVVKQVWIQSFPSPRLLASPRLKNFLLDAQRKIHIYYLTLNYILLEHLIALFKICSSFILSYLNKILFKVNLTENRISLLFYEYSSNTWFIPLDMKPFASPHSRFIPLGMNPFTSPHSRFIPLGINPFTSPHSRFIPLAINPFTSPHSRFIPLGINPFTSPHSRFIPLGMNPFTSPHSRFIPLGMNPFTSPRFRFILLGMNPLTSPSL